MLQIEKEHKRSSLLSSKKVDLVNQIMYLEHNNNVLHETIKQQVENFKILLAESPIVYKTIIKMIDYDGEPVPEELCSVGSDGEADDFDGCGKCFDNEEADCENCIVNKIFKEYAQITGQTKIGAE